MYIRIIIFSALLVYSWMAHAATLSSQIFVVNQSRSPISCQALTGHWYSFDLGTAPAAQRLDFRMNWNPNDGVVSMKSPLRQDIPLQVIYCGYVGNAWKTRASIPLRRLAQTAAQSGQATLICAAGSGHLECTIQ